MRKGVYRYHGVYYRVETKTLKNHVAAKSQAGALRETNIFFKPPSPTVTFSK